MQFRGNDRLDRHSMPRTFAFAAAVAELASHRLGGAVDSAHLMSEMRARFGNVDLDMQTPPREVLRFEIKNEDRAIAMKPRPTLLAPRAVDFIVRSMPCLLPPAFTIN